MSAVGVKSSTTACRAAGFYMAQYCEDGSEKRSMCEFVESSPCFGLRVWESSALSGECDAKGTPLACMGLAGIEEGPEEASRLERLLLGRSSLPKARREMSRVLQ